MQHQEVTSIRNGYGAKSVDSEITVGEKRKKTKIQVDCNMSAVGLVWNSVVALCGC